MRFTARVVSSLPVLVLIVSAGLAEAQTAPPASTPVTLSAAAQRFWSGVKRNVTEAAEKMPEADYGFRPVDTVRTFAGFVGHIADANFAYCSLAKGEKNPSQGGADKLTTKAEVVAALTKAVAYCDEVYNGLTDATAAKLVKMGPNETPAIAVLFGNVSHTNEHYGNLVTYMRIKGLVPPSTERAQQPRK
jgi:uncharacterized damage-inducible protein DinB